MKKIYTYKILPILSVFLLVLFVFTSSVFADSNVTFSGYYNNILFDSDIISSSLPNGVLSMNVNNYIVLYDTIDCKYFLWTTYGGHYDISNFYIIKSSENSLEINCDNAYTIYYFDSDSMSCCYSSGGASDWYYSTGNVLGHYIFDLTRFDLVISNFNLYTSSDCLEINNSFFQLAPQPLAEIMLVELKEKRTMAEIVGLVPLILVVVVSFLGLRKALNWLLTLLRGC